MQLNSQHHTTSRKTHEGASSKQINVLEELTRTVSACLLWEDQFYENGVSIADRIRELVKVNKAQDVSKLAIHARTNLQLRHAPLLLARELARCARGKIVGHTITNVIQRADELTEFLAIYWSDGKCPLSAQVKLGLAQAWPKFNAYQLAKYNRNKKTTLLRDCLFLCHAKPKNKAQAATWRKLANGTLKSPDTWEVGLSAGGDKKEVFTRLLQENKLGYMALLRNLRNMVAANVKRELIASALISGAKKSKGQHFRYVSAAIACPSLAQEIDVAMELSLRAQTKLPGSTALIIDVSGSMRQSLSSKSTLTHIQTAGALAVLLRGICYNTRIFIFAETWREVPSRTGLSLIDAIVNTNVGRTTKLGQTVKEIQNFAAYDRTICITDEQTQDAIPNPQGDGYIVNVASCKNGIGYGRWTHISGLSSSIVSYIQEAEADNYMQETYETFT